MRRRVSTLIIFLLLGALVNVAVAWGICLTIEFETRHPSANSSRVTLTQGKVGINRRSVARWDHFGTVYISETRIREIGPRRMHLRPVGSEPEELIPAWFDCVVMPDATEQRGPVYISTRQEEARGWPVVALKWTIDHVWFESKETHGGMSVGLAPRLSGGVHPEEIPRLLPLLPIWPGIAINMIFYAAILWMMSFVPGVLRRKRRLKRGLCIHCAYDLRGAPPASPKCPECGMAASSSR